MSKSIKKRHQTKRGTHPHSLANLHNGKQGRPLGSKNHDGLGAVLQMLKDMVSENENLVKLHNHLQGVFDKNPTVFFIKILMPLLPKSVDLKSSDDNNLTIIVSNAYQPKIKPMENNIKSQDG